MSDETDGGTPAPSKPAGGSDRKELHRLVDELLDHVTPDQPERTRRFAHQLVYAATRAAQSEEDVLNLKIMARSLKELGRGFKAFAPYSDVRKIAVFGSARSKPESDEYQMAVECSRMLAEHDYMVVTGAGPGIMEAANKGAGRDMSFGVNIWLPFEQRANKFIDGDPKLVEFRYFFTRKVVFVKETDGVILFPGGFGTHDEGFETLTLVQTGKTEPRPIVMIEPPGSTYWEDWDAYIRKSLLGRGLISEDDLGLYTIVKTPEEAVAQIERFYRNFHSIRYVDGHLIIRLQHAPTELLMEKLNGEFQDILKSGAIEVCAAHPLEADEPEVADLHRIRLHFDQRHLGRLRSLIDVLTAAVTPDQAATGIAFKPVHRITALASELNDEDFET